MQLIVLNAINKSISGGSLSFNFFPIVGTGTRIEKFTYPLNVFIVAGIVQIQMNRIIFTENQVVWILSVLMPFGFNSKAWRYPIGNHCRIFTFYRSRSFT